MTCKEYYLVRVPSLCQPKRSARTHSIINNSNINLLRTTTIFLFQNLFYVMIRGPTSKMITIDWKVFFKLMNCLIVIYFIFLCLLDSCWCCNSITIVEDPWIGLLLFLQPQDIPFGYIF